MSYRTYFTLRVLDKRGAPIDTASEHEIIDKIREMNEDACFAFDVGGQPIQDNSWYNNHADMLKISKKFPDHILELSGEGEESADIWTRWFLNGKSDGGHAEIVYPKLNLKKLKGKSK